MDIAPYTYGSRADGWVGAEAPLPDWASTPLQFLLAERGTGKFFSNLSNGDSGEGAQRGLSNCKKASWWVKMQVAVGWGLFFGLHLEKLGASAKICTVMLSHTYTTEKVFDKRLLIRHCVSLAPPLLNPACGSSYTSHIWVSWTPLCKSSAQHTHGIETFKRHL